MSYMLIITICFIVFFSLGVFAGYLFASRRENFISKLETITEKVLNIPIQGFDRQGKIFLWNRASEMTYGYLRDEAIGKSFFDLVLNGSEKEIFLENINLMCSTLKPLPARQWTMLTRGGQKKTMYSTFFPLIRFGRCDSLFCIDVDISDIKKYEQELSFSRENYRAIFDGVNDAVAVIDPDQGKILMVNDQMCVLFGLSKDKTRDMLFEELFYGDKERIKNELKAVISKVYYEGAQIFELLMMKKNKQIFNAELSLKKAALNGKACILAEVHDITKHKLVEQELRDSENRYVNLLKNSDSLIFSLDKKGVISSVNDAVEKVFLYKEKDVVGQHFQKFLLPEEQLRAQALFKEIMDKGQDKRGEFKCLKGDGSKLIAIINAWPYYKDKEIAGIHGLATDITAQKEVVDKMKEMVIEIVSMLSETVSVADRYTEKHCERIQDLAIKIGAKLNLGEIQLEHLKFASLLHDVGKVGIPIHILVKKEKLTDEEWEKIKEHPKKGADIVRQLSGFEEVAAIIEQHQERLDGKGYPMGLKKEQIKKEATIISVVDAFDAMTSDRPYRKAMSIQDAVDELKKHAGTQFDPEVVEALISIVSEQSS